jgi:hydrophobe/amphiphile efflux-1 (HAE1) family protein
MQWLAEICVRRPVFAAMLVLALVVAGAAAYLRLGIDRFPKMDFPTVYVRTTLPGAGPEEVESEVTQPIEEAVATVEGIDELRSISSESTSLLLLTFNLNRDVDAAAQDVRDAVSTVLNRLPRDVDPPTVRKMDTDSSPILSLALSGPREPRELYVLADRYVKEVIESAPGVGQVQISGASDRAVQVEVNAERLAAYRLSITQVREALARQNAEIPGGRVDAGARELSLRTLGRFAHPRDFPELVISTAGPTPVRLKDIGRVIDGQKEARTLARLNGKPAVVLQVQRQTGANTIEVIAAVKARLERSRALLPADVSLELIQDQSRYIKAAMREIRLHLIFGSILASAVVLLFMKSWRSTLIASLAIPASIVATFGVMRLFDFTLNNVTMLALVLMVGVVIDDAIVVLENIFHAMEENGLPAFQAAVQGTREIGLAVLATTFSLVIVFLPVSFLSSQAGRFLFQFGITASVAILVSLLVSFTLTPMMCARMLRPKRRHAAVAGHGGEVSEIADSRRGFYRYLDRGYDACLRLAMRHRWVVAVLSLLVIASNVPLYYMVQQDYVPTNVDEGEFEVSVTAPEGASLAAMDRTLQAVEAELRQINGVVHLLTTVGSSGLGRINTASIYVRLDDIETRTFSLGRLVRETLHGRPQHAWEGNYSQRQKILEARRRLAHFTDLRLSIRNLQTLRGTGAPVDIDFVLTGPDLTPLARVSEELRKRAEELPGIVDVDTTLRLDKPELHVEIDRERAAALGVDAAEIAESLRIMVGGDERVSRYRDPALDDVYDVELRLVGDDRGSKAAIGQLYVRARSPSGRARDEAMAPGIIRLDNVVQFRDSLTPARIDRLDRQKMVAVRANIAPGFALGDRIAALRQAADDIGLPPGYATRVLGRGRELERTLKDFAFAFILSLIFMYIILAAQFEHVVHPLTILISLPLAVPFGLVSLWVGGETLNLYSALGILVLFGVVKKNSILQVDHTNQLRAAGMDRLSAILQANRDRLRPILMTTLAFVAGMLPMVIGTGPGAEERRSIAVLVLGGQTLSLLLTLLATPVVYSYLDDLSALFRRRSPKPVIDANSESAVTNGIANGSGSASSPLPVSSAHVQR